MSRLLLPLVLSDAASNVGDSSSVQLAITGCGQLPVSRLPHLEAGTISELRVESWQPVTRRTVLSHGTRHGLDFWIQVQDLLDTHSGDRLLGGPHFFWLGRVSNQFQQYGNIIVTRLSESVP